MTQTIIDFHLGVRFKVEAIPHGETFQGRYTLLENDLAGETGTDDSYRPATENNWATEDEALTYATEAAHHAIEGIPPFTKGQPERV